MTHSHRHVPYLILVALLYAITVVGVARAAETTDYWADRGCVADDPRCQWFRDAKFGAIIHFGVYSELGGYYQGKGPYRPAEQIMGLGERRATISPDEYLKNVAAKFNPTAFDAEQWVAQMKAAGQRYVVITTKHHDGFCMFATKTTKFNVVEATPFGRDVVKELGEACRKHDMKFCLYYSIGDWSARQVMNSEFTSYDQYMKAQLKELLTNYGKIDLVWFDNYWYVDDQYTNDDAHARDLYNYVRGLQPDTLVNDRCGAGMESDHGDFATPENQLKGSLQSRYFEVVMTNTADDNWGWVRTAENYRKPSTIVQNIVDSASKGGNFVFNIGPDNTGAIPAPQAELLSSIGKWTTTNAKALYDTVPAPDVKFVTGRNAYATQSHDGNTIYLQIGRWPRNGPIVVWLKNADDKKVTATMLDPSLSTREISQTTKDEGIEVTIPRPAKLAEFMTVIKLAK